ncbi:DUF2726 domain-containing protein [Roseateles sp. DAIF2]|uniref:DUF2726 domain-containing protein n=1 Tax=Roseateles sp. DAIF2 TaxID=2714952 RepID=UPI00201E2B62|nr:DUF2726 domain-containing protein [Roseateles sp. DAIF2]
MRLLDTPTLWLLLLLFVGMAVLLALMGKGRRRASGRVAGRKPLTEREQAMYFRLTQNLPDHVVLAQVAFSSLINTKDRPTRATFDRKVADFVVCTKDFAVVAVVELDDASHKGRAQQDAARDALLQKAGHRVIRFRNVPDGAEVRAVVAPPTQRASQDAVVA